MNVTPLFLLLFALVGITSCKKKDALAGFDSEALFAPPAAAEINEVADMWARRNLVPTNAMIEQSHAINQELSLHIISFRLANMKEYAAVLLPVADGPLPVVFYVGGFGLEDAPVNSLQVALAEQPESLPFIYVLPSLRGQSLELQLNDTRFTSPLSDGSRFEAFDGAADDVIASLNATGILFPEADTATAMIRGGSRGGTVALLAAERDGRFRRAAAVAFNVDFVASTAAHANDPTYKAQFLDDLIDGAATVEQTRKKMIASSPLYFCSRLPKTQLHYAANDRITPASQGEALISALKSLGVEDRVQLFVYPGRGHDDIATGNTELETRINNFFSELW